MPVKFLDEHNQKIWVEIGSRRIYRLITEVWEALPDEAKAMACERVNQITDNEPPRVDPTDSAGLSVPMPWGSEIYLPPQDLQKPSDEWVKYLIAHELAHGIFHNPHFGGIVQEWKEEERQADETAEAWGFPDPYRKKAA